MAPAPLGSDLARQAELTPSMRDPARGDPCSENTIAINQHVD